MVVFLRCCRRGGKLAVLKIPERYRPGFVVLAGLSDSSFEEFLSAAKTAPSNFANIHDLEVWISAGVKNVPSKDISKLIEAIASFYRLQSRRALTTSKLSVDLADGARESIKNLQLADGVDLRGRIAALLGLDSFNIVSVKAKELQNQAERIFCEARVLTDLRPVFPETISAPPSAMVVIHTLKIVYHEGGSHKEFFVSLDEEDITSLRKTMERAAEKSGHLKALLDTKGLHSVDLSQEEGK